MSKTKIAWTEFSWNPVIGCTKISPGCENCYAEKMAHRLSAMSVRGYDDGVVHRGKWTGKIVSRENEYEKPYHWLAPRKIFVCNMGDLFHPNVPVGCQLGVYETITDDRGAHHTYQILTKRPEIMEQFHQNHVVGALPNVWLGVSCSTQAEADKNIPILMQIPAAVRFVSLEPLLEAVRVDEYTEKEWRCDSCGSWYSHFQDATCNHCGRSGRHVEYRNQIHQVIVGCESGPKRRPCKLEWVRSIVQECKEAGVACFVKQLSLKGCRKCRFGPCTHLAGHKQIDIVSHDPQEWPKDLRVRKYPQ